MDATEEIFVRECGLTNWCFCLRASGWAWACVLGKQKQGDASLARRCFSVEEFVLSSTADADARPRPLSG